MKQTKDDIDAPSPMSIKFDKEEPRFKQKLQSVETKKERGLEQLDSF